MIFYCAHYALKIYHLRKLKSKDWLIGSVAGVSVKLPDVASGHPQQNGNDHKQMDFALENAHMGKIALSN